MGQWKTFPSCHAVQLAEWPCQWSLATRQPHRVAQAASATVCMPPPFTGGCSHKTTSAAQLQNMACSNQSPNADQHCGYTCLSIFIVVFGLEPMGFYFHRVTGGIWGAKRFQQSTNWLMVPAALNESFTSEWHSKEWTNQRMLCRYSVSTPLPPLALFSLSHSLHSFSTPLPVSTCFYCFGTPLSVSTCFFHFLWYSSLSVSTCFDCFGTPVPVSTCFYCFGTPLSLSPLVLVFTTLVLLPLCQYFLLLWYSCLCVSTCFYYFGTPPSMPVLVFTTLILLSLCVSTCFYYFGTPLCVLVLVFTTLVLLPLCQYLFWLLWYCSLH